MIIPELDLGTGNIEQIVLQLRRIADYIEEQSGMVIDNAPLMVARPTPKTRNRVNIYLDNQILTFEVVEDQGTLKLDYENYPVGETRREFMDRKMNEQE